MKKNPKTGYVEYDKEQCASCYMCIMSCPYGILKYDSINQMEIMKCTMCVHRSEDGTGNPMCVEKCPMNAITVEEVENSSSLQQTWARCVSCDARQNSSETLSSKKTKYVVIGASAAGINAIRELRKRDKEGEIILISKDKEIYSRCILHHYLSGHRTLEELNFAEPDFTDLYHVQWMKGKACTAVKPEEKVVVLEDGEEVTYDKLLIATGSCTFIPPIKNLKEATNVIGFRSVNDIDTLKEVVKTHKNVLVIGAGLVGMDCVSGLIELDVNVSIVEMAEWMLVKQLDPRAAKTYEEAFTERGVRQYYGVGVSEAVLDSEGKITSVILSDGTNIPCDYVVVTTGVRANVGFLEGSGLKLSKTGLVYDETGKTSNDDIYAAGDVSGMSPIWPVAVKEGIIAASNMTGNPNKMTDFFASKSTMNFLGIPSMALGNVNPEDDSYSVEILETKDSYKKIVHKDGKIVGAILQGDLAYGGILQQLIARNIDVTKVKKPIFDIDYSDFFHTKENFEFYFEDK